LSIRGAIWSNGTANRSCSTKLSRSAGVSVSSTTIIASPTSSARIASDSGVCSTVTIGSGIGSSRRAPRLRSMLRLTRPTTVAR